MQTYINIGLFYKTMQVKKLMKKIESNSEFKEWKKKNKKDYLVHIFNMFDKTNKGVFQIGYYNSNKDKITSFIIEKNDIKLMPEENIFKKPKSKIKKLNITKVKIDFKAALDKAVKFQKKKYKVLPIKTIIILQNLPIGQVYNITFVTQAFQTVNIKIDSSDGNILKHEIVDLMQFDKQEK